MAWLIAHISDLGLGALLLLQALSIFLHMAHADNLAELDDKVVDSLKQLGVKPPQP